MERIPTTELTYSIHFLFSGKKTFCQNRFCICLQSGNIMFLEKRICFIKRNKTYTYFFYFLFPMVMWYSGLSFHSYRKCSQLTQNLVPWSCQCLSLHSWKVTFIWQDIEINPRYDFKFLQELIAINLFQRAGQQKCATALSLQRLSRCFFNRNFNCLSRRSFHTHIQITKNRNSFLDYVFVSDQEEHVISMYIH